MRDSHLLKPIIEFLLKQRQQGEGRPNNFSGEISFDFSKIRKDVPGLHNLSKLEELFGALKQKDCWFNSGRDSAIHEFSIRRGTHEASAIITVDCSTGFLKAKLKDLNDQIENTGEKKVVIIVDNLGISIKSVKNSKYTISGQRKKIVNFLISNGANPIPAKNIAKKFNISKISSVSDEIKQINDIFFRKFKDSLCSKTQLIINKPLGSGYRLNTEKFIVKKG